MSKTKNPAVSSRLVEQGELRQIKIKDETHEELKALAKYGDTMDDVRKCINAYKKLNKL